MAMYPGGFSGISNEMKKYYKENKQTKPDVDVKDRLIRKMEHEINQKFQGSQLCMFGSSVTGFGTKGCDADTCLWFPGLNYRAGIPRDQHRASDILQQIYKHVEKNPNLVGDIEVLPPTAAVPIMKCRHLRSGIWMDIGVNNTGGIVNSYLLKLYADYDDRVPPLGLIIKQWAKVCDPSQGTLSSFSWILMLIHYLQVGCNPPVLPVYQPNRGNWDSFPAALDDMDIQQIRDLLRGRFTGKPNPFRLSQQVTLRNTSNLYELLQGFFTYYVSFNFGIHAIDIRTGMKTRRQQYSSQPVFIQAPIQGHNAASLVSAPGLQKIQVALQKALVNVRKPGTSLSSLLPA